MSQPRSKTVNRKPPLPGGSLPDFLVWPVLLVIPLICLVGAWTTPPVATPDELKAAVSQILLSLLLLVYFWRRRREQESVLHFSPPVYAFTALFLLGTLSLVWSVNPEFWFYKWSRWYAAFIIFLFGLQLRQSTLNLDRVFQACLLAGVITAVVGISQQLFGMSFIPQSAFPASTFGNGNVAGEIMIFTFPLGLYFLCKPDLSRREAWLYALAMCLVAMYAFYTRTRAVWLALFLETLLVGIFILLDPRRATWLYWDREKTRSVATMTVVFLVMINFGQQGFQPFWRVAAFELNSIVTDIGDNQGNDASPRYLIWSSTLDMIQDSPWIGTGVGSFFENINNGQYSIYSVMGVQRVHNDVLELAVDLGALGLLCLAAIIVTFCRQLYFLLLRAGGGQRLAYALLVIAVTGVMLEAQLSFPFELPVPLVMMALYMAIVIRGADHYAPEDVRVVRAGPWFNPLALTATTAMLAIVSAINLQWLYDFHQVNRLLINPLANSQWKPASFLMSQAHITLARGVSEALATSGGDQIALNVIIPVVAYWPEAPAHTLMMTRHNFHLERYEQAETWALKTIAVQPANTYIGELQLLDVYREQDAQEKLADIYTRMKLLPDEVISAYANTLNVLHFTSIMLQDHASTPRFYTLYVQRYGQLAMMEANQAIFLLNVGNTEYALPHMRTALKLDPATPMAGDFRRILAETAP